MPRRLLLVLLLAALVAAACSSGARPAEAPQEGAPAIDRVAEPEPAVLRLALVEPDDLDPTGLQLTSPSAMVAIDLLLDGLTSIDAQSGAVVPELARSWQVSDSGLRWRFDLETNADGTPLVSGEDVAWTMGRLAAQGAQSIPGSALAPVRGYADATDGTLDGVEAVQSDRVVIHLDRPFAALPALLAHPSMGILPAGIEQAPIGAGPTSSAFETEATADGLVLTAGDRFGGSVDEVHITWMSDEASAVAAVTAEQADLAPVLSGHERETQAEVMAPFGATVFFGMNLGHPNLVDPGLRRAIVQAVDPIALSGAFDERGMPLLGLVPGSDVCEDACGHDPDVAAQLVEFTHGDTEPPTVAIDFLADDDREQELAQALVADLAEAGIPSELRPGTLTELEDRIAAGEHQVFRFGWVAPYDDEQAWLDMLFRSDGADNVFNLADDDIDQLIDELAGTVDPDERSARAAELEREILTEYVVVPILARRQVMVHGDGVSGIVSRPDGTVDVEQVLVD